MAFRWPSVFHDIALATEVARDRPEKPCEWDKIALYSNHCETSIKHFVINLQ